MLLLLSMDHEASIVFHFAAVYPTPNGSIFFIMRASIVEIPALHMRGHSSRILDPCGMGFLHACGPMGIRGISFTERASRVRPRPSGFGRERVAIRQLFWGTFRVGCGSGDLVAETTAVPDGG